MEGLKNKTIMAVGGHVGDMELTCGGILSECSLGNGRIITVALTGGEKGTPANMTVEEYRKQKESEAAAFAAMLGGTSYVLPYEDGELPDNEEVRFQVCDLIRREKPDLLLTHYEGSMHKDHAACSRIVKDAWFYASIGGFRRALPSHFAKLMFTENWEDNRGFKPYLYYGISEKGFALWQEAVKTHWFVTGSTSFPYYEYYSHLKRIRGIEARKPYAESFMLLPEDYRVVSAL
mgnify:CR=1 FL=1